MRIRKAVIPAAGLGTRFLPATKTIPKEMLPIVDKPTILYNVEELYKAGIEEVVLIAGRDKTSIEDFFDKNYELDEVLRKTGKPELLAPLRELRQRVRVISIRQRQALGLGHAVLCAEPIIGKEPFAVLLGDEIMITPEGQPSAIAQLAKVHQDSGLSAVAVMEVPPADVGKYGIAGLKAKGENLWSVESIVEKPSPEKAPSRWALPGRYVFNSEIFTFLRETQPGHGGEIQLTDAMAQLARTQGMLATVLRAQRFDAGDKLGFLQANVEIALKHPEIAREFAGFLKSRFGGAQ